ncbi:SDR family oxidoreductase [Tenacibaculum jejuense]|uniref:Oxidoreductase, short chain dehydrogenase/reductase family protein n=1 Tax=Tenacibaculum jejuense TaxID=584609 RepID=A0A238U8I5_9FLAO|nr:SDR family oxidoreductase [Tenacibaculum jejuense]SNR14898.1 Oxidoreductase, short chain dehydrogenase/reductase family protein [Tenacibaculum jejuense]
MSERLKSKVIIVTGAKGLIGNATRISLLKNGATVVAVDVVADVENNIMAFNVTEEEAIDGLISFVLEKHGRIDGLVNLAYPRTKDWGTKFEHIKLSSWRENVDMQMNMVFYMCQKVLDVMKSQRSGSIVNIGSIYGVVGNDFSLYEDYGGTSPAAYAAVKGGIINLTRYLASYYGKFNIRVNCLSPGGILSKDQQHKSFIQRYSEKSLLGRLGNPEEIAQPIVFLLSDDASFITGHNLMVDGGWTAI